MTVGRQGVRAPLATAPRSAPHAGGGDWRGVAAVLFAVAWGGNSFTPLLGLYQQALGLDELAVNVLLAAYVVGIIPALFLSAPLHRRLGPRRLLLPLAPLSALGSLLLVAGNRGYALLFLGRAVIGLALGVAMVVGAVWLTALCSERGGGDRGGGVGARRAALSLTAGFGSGAAVMGVLAQWAPAPTALPYTLHLALCAVAGVWVLRSPDVPPPTEPPGGPAPPLPARTLLRVLPVAPWIFGSLGLAYAVLPQVVRPRLGGLVTVYSALLCLLSLGGGFLVQKWLARRGGWRRLSPAPVGFALFLAVVAVTVPLLDVLSPWLVPVLCLLLGAAYGLMVAGCLVEVEATVPRARLARAVSLVWACAYGGFALPVAVSTAHRLLGWGNGLTLVVTATAALTVVALGRLAAHRTPARTSETG
ncbi:MFS transporter [Streptomyces sp. NPDC005438]|uniref:MFS transporter n=1 Tax=Streptomyces sp. NPDC005438 TaxID=3156880 RepID=UPI0033A111E0